MRKKEERERSGYKKTGVKRKRDTYIVNEKKEQEKENKKNDPQNKDNRRRGEK